MWIFVIVAAGVPRVMCGANNVSGQPNKFLEIGAIMSYFIEALVFALEAFLWKTTTKQGTIIAMCVVGGMGVFLALRFLMTDHIKVKSE